MSSDQRTKVQLSEAIGILVDKACTADTGQEAQAYAQAACLLKDCNICQVSSVAEKKTSHQAALLSDAMEFVEEVTSLGTRKLGRQNMIAARDLLDAYSGENDEDDEDDEDY